MKLTLKKMLLGNNGMLMNFNIAQLSHCINGSSCFSKPRRNHDFSIYYSGKMTFFKRSALQKRKSNFYGKHTQLISKKLWEFHKNLIRQK